MEQTKEFMLLFSFDPSVAENTATAGAVDSHRLWGEFIGQLAMQEKLVSTYQLKEEGVLLEATGATHEGVGLADKKMIGGNMVVRVKSVAEAVEISRACPILAMAGRVEIREIQPMN